ncbi:MAG: GntR family transcriptional regulator [Acidimicrobiia bacterium]|nr:GntR family transcriptional regulator [Acidimicrobiia bacterium]
MSKEAEKRFTADRIYEQLRDRICILELPPGTPLREQAIAEEFGVSRTPVREALTKLRIDGLVTRQPGGGTSVSGVDLKSMRDVYSLRLKLTELFADFMIVPVPVGTIERLHEIRAATLTDSSKRDARLLGHHYNQFHETLLSTIGNEPLREIADRLFRRTARVWIQVLPDMDWDEEVRIMVAEIDDCLDALETGSADLMAKFRSDHLTTLLNRYNQYLTRSLI